MKKQRNNLIRPQPSLGETIAGKATEEGIRGFFGWLANRKNKNLSEEMKALLPVLESIDNRLKEIEEKLNAILK